MHTVLVKTVVEVVLEDVVVAVALVVMVNNKLFSVFGCLFVNVPSRKRCTWTTWW